MSKLIAIIGGSGVYELPFLKVTKRIKPKTLYGEPSGEIIIGTFANKQIAFLPRHGNKHEFLPHNVNYRANIAALAELSPLSVIAIGTVGGISPKCKTGSIIVPDQLIDYTYGRPNTFSEHEDIGHIDFTFPFDRLLRNQILEAAKSVEEVWVDGGVYAVTQGPRLETAAEILRLQKDGADIVGMTAMPEAILAKEKKLSYALVSPVVNPAAGIEGSSEGIKLESLYERVTKMSSRILKVLQSFVENQ